MPPLAQAADQLRGALRRVRAGADLVPVTIPSGPSPVRSRRFWMHALGDRDQVVRALRRGGWEAFEAPLPSVVVQLVRRWPQTVLDVGANTGLYSLVAVTAHHQARAVAYEPVPEIAALLRANLAVNPQGRRVSVRELAVGDESGPTELHLPPPQPDGTIETSASLQPDFKQTIERVVPVEAATLDDAWSAEGRPAVSVVKVDVEGAEHRVLAGAHQLVAQCRPVVTIEVLTAAELDMLERLRREWDYVDLTLGPTDVVVDHPSVQAHPHSPNHLLVPRERLRDAIEELRALPSLTVSLLS